MALLHTVSLVVVLALASNGVEALCGKCELVSNSNADFGMDISGTIQLTQDDDLLLIEIAATGFNASVSATQHGFHIHESADTSRGCDSTGGHYNPTSNNHSSPDAVDRHVGDLGNVQVETDGTISAMKNDTVAKLSGAYSILDKPIVIHADPDDLVSQPTGNAGSRYACCIILETQCGGAGANVPALFTLVSIAGTILAAFTL